MKRIPSKDELVDLLRTNVPEWNLFVKKISDAEEHEGPYADQYEELLSKQNSWYGFSNMHHESSCTFPIDMSYTDLSNIILDGAMLPICLEGANFNNSKIENTHFNWANLRGATFHGADLYNVNFICSNLVGASFNSSINDHCRFSQCDLANSSFNQSYFRMVDIRECYIVNTDFEGADLYDLAFIDQDLSEAKNLDRCIFSGPSSIDVKSIYKSGAKISSKFLSGIGVPIKTIEHFHELANLENIYPPCFISYSYDDELFAQKLFSTLRERNVSVWYAPHDMMPGQKLLKQIEIGIQSSAKVILILSLSSMNSNWVAEEILLAQKKAQAQNCDVLFPISICDYASIKTWRLFDSDSGIDVARIVREYFVPNFSEAINFDMKIEQLLQGLKCGLVSND